MVDTILPFLGLFPPTLKTYELIVLFQNKFNREAEIPKIM